MSEREDYIAKLKAKVDEWNEEIGKFEAKARSAQIDLKHKYEAQLDTLKQQRDQAQEKLHELRNAGDDAWKILRDGAETAWENLSQAIKDARNRFK